MCGDELGVTMNIGEFDFRSPFEDLHDIESLICKLRDLLTTALPDDLLDDESSSLSSSLSPDKNSSPEPWQDDDEQHEQRRHQEQFPDWVNNLERLRNNLQHGLHHQTSTPQVGVNLPPLKTPAAYQEYDYFRELQMEMVFLCLLMEPT
ncbi:uncharacterized protein [Amphiura filiformis]|uniref:uncharacterized protein isoform X2 n=1 Tax=Amphiura filiformis TaxID=82378 RepID=UPI003B210B92